MYFNASIFLFSELTLNILDTLIGISFQYKYVNIYGCFNGSRKFTLVKTVIEIMALTNVWLMFIENVFQYTIFKVPLETYQLK